MAKIIAHRGFGKYNYENSIEAFTFAASTDCYGIETDVHPTPQGFLCYHDESKLTHGHKAPTLQQYLDICISGDKVAVIELKPEYAKSDIVALVNRVRNLGWLDNTVFISFHMSNMLTLRELLPTQSLQFVTIMWDPMLLDILVKNKLDLDIEHNMLTKKRVTQAHELGLQVNCWTVDGKRATRFLEKCGVDYITTDVLQPEPNR